MNILSLIIAIIALIVAVLAFQRTGGIKNLRENTASLLAKMEQAVSNESETAEKKKGKTIKKT
ncbi:MAG: hypothetical protein U9R43_01130 [Thermodesulfobacteriota bacterium]|nr:hypothetical protein [Thermodesulfobacteriota bacterium]